MRGQRICERRHEIDSLVAALTLWPCVPVDVRESHCLTDGHFLAFVRTAFSDARTAWHQKRAASVSTDGLAEASATSTSATRIFQAGCLAIAEQLPTLGCESRESADERRESPAVQRWEGYR